IRPPAEESVAMCTVLAAAGLARYSPESRRTEADAAVARARAWLDAAERPLHEDRVARAWGWKLLGGTDAERDAARQALFDTQRADGGWSQLPELASDAYATGTALYALLEAGVSHDHHTVVRGSRFLLESQQPDGSWHVVTRAKPVQVFFDNGDPHGTDQFVSMMATGWSAAVLARVALAAAK
ncbi:MAG: N-acyl-D-aspartate/D-glutamate deacylase, partial [Planctomycetaceae bacterium]